MAQNTLHVELECQSKDCKWLAAIGGSAEFNTIGEARKQAKIHNEHTGHIVRVSQVSTEWFGDE